MLKHINVVKYCLLKFKNGIVKQLNY